MSHDWHSGWRRKAKPAGQYKTSFFVPENFLSEMRINLKLVITTYEPFQIQVEVPEAVAFNVYEVDDDGTARGDSPGYIPGAVRPNLQSTTSLLRELPAVASATFSR